MSKINGLKSKYQQGWFLPEGLRGVCFLPVSGSEGSLHSLTHGFFLIPVSQLLASLMPHLPFMLWSCCTPCLRTFVISVSHWIVQDNLSISKSLITSVKLLLPCKVTIHKSWELWHDNFVLIYYTMQVSLCSREQDGPWEGIWQTPSSSIHYKILQSSNDRLIFM